MNRRDFLKLAAGASAALAVSQCSGPYKAIKKAMDEEKADANFYAEDGINEEIGRMQVQNELDNVMNSGFPDDVQELVGEDITNGVMGYGSELLTVGIFAKGNAQVSKEFLKKIKIEGLSDQLGDLLLQVYPEINGTSVDWKSKSTVYYPEGNKHDFVVKVPKEATGASSDYWFKFIKEPKQCGDINSFNETLEITRKNGLRYGYLTEEQANSLALRKTQFVLGEKPTNYYVYRTPNIGGVRFDLAVETGMISKEYAKKLYLGWFEKSLDLIREGNIDAVHQDAGLQNFFIRKNPEGKLVAAPFDFEGNQYVYTSPAAAAAKHTTEVMMQLDDKAATTINGKVLPGLRTRGLDISSSELIDIYLKKFPEIPEFRAPSKVCIKVPAESLPNLRIPVKIEAVFLSDDLHGIPDAQAALKKNMLRTISENGARLEGTMPIDFPLPDGGIKRLNIRAIPGAIDVPQLELAKGKTSTKALLKLLGERALKGAEVVGTALEVVGALFMLSEMFDLKNNPSIQTVHGQESADQKPRLIPSNNFFKAQFDNIEQVAAQLVGASHLADTFYPNVLNQLNVPADFQVQALTIDPEKLKNFKEVLLKLRLSEILFKIPFSNEAYNKLLANRANINEELFNRLVEQRMMMIDMMRDSLQEKGIWNRIIMTRPNTPGFNNLEDTTNQMMSRSVFNGDNSEVYFAGTDENGNLVEKVVIRFKKSGNWVKIESIEPLDANPNIPITVGIASYLLKTDTEEDRLKIIEDFNRTGTFILTEA